ncbi:MAG: quinol:cytochrome C oxidoreductase, partial [Thermogutta sp.]|nr:quinol:cytochrome C oxidoreductase [Thermogutta sp.]
MSTSVSAAAAAAPPPGLKPWVGRLGIAGVGCLAAAFALSFSPPQNRGYFFHAYLTQFAWVLSIGLGALFFVILQHATRAGWSVTVRRSAEAAAAAVPILCVLFLPVGLPVLLGSDSVYPWVNRQTVLQDESLRHKALYLNVPFFAVRAVLCLAAWWLLARFYRRSSVLQDAAGDPELTRSMERWSGPALLLYALTVTVAAIDWLMSLTPHWFSTIYGLYYFSGAIVGGTAFLILLILTLRGTGRLDSRLVTVEHLHDLGKLLFGFVIFWGYIAFSQYMLIWYANMPEETQYYLPRQSGGWVWVSIALIVGHLFIPMLGLMSRAAKRNAYSLAFWSIWLLVFHWLDVYWLVMPKVNPEFAGFGWIDGLTAAGGLLVFSAAVLDRLAAAPLVPLRDPRLSEAL